MRTKQKDNTLNSKIFFLKREAIDIIKSQVFHTDAIRDTGINCTLSQWIEESLKISSENIIILSNGQAAFQRNLEMIVKSYNLAGKLRNGIN